MTPCITWLVRTLPCARRWLSRRLLTTNPCTSKHLPSSSLIKISHAVSSLRSLFSDENSGSLVQFSLYGTAVEIKDASGGRQIHLTTVRSLSRLQDRRSERKCTAISGRDADVKRSQAIQRLTPHNVRRVFVLLTDQESTFVFAVVLSIAARALQVLDRYSDELSEFLTSEIRQNVRGYH